MKLFRHGTAGREKPGILINSQLKDVSAHFDDYNELFFENNGLDRLKTLIANPDELPTLPDSVRLGPPVARPSKLLCVGLNYVDHVKETGADMPKEPVLFFKSTTAICGPNDDVIIPRGSTQTDWEVEIAFVIGKKASYVAEEEAMNYVAGYCLHNDYSEREYQLHRSGQWCKGKGCDTFAPLGPWLVTKDEIDDVDNLPMWLSVNDYRYQNSTTANMIFKIPFLVSYISQFMTLLPGDIVSTGTPPGVGLGIKPDPVYLKAGDVVNLGIEGLGESQQNAIAWSR